MKYIVGFYFNSEKLKVDELSYNRKRKWIKAIMYIWMALVLIYCCFDFGFNYFDYYIFHDNQKQKPFAKDLNPPPADFMLYTYYVVASQFVVLTLLIIWHTMCLNKIISKMGDRLLKEQRRLRILKIAFSISYIGISTYYIIRAATDLNCTNRDSCVRFEDLMMLCFVQICFD